MSENVKHINLRKSPLPRTGRELDAVGGTITSVSGGFSSSGGGGGEPINISISQGDGIEVTGSETSYTISHADTSDALNTENTDTSVITNVQIDKFGHVTGIESGDVTTELDGRYIRKDIPDIDRSHLILAGGVKVENGANTDTLNVEKTATTLNLIVKELADTYDLNVEHVATLFQTIVKDYISSSLFIPGFTGSGMKLYQALNGDWNLELDNLTVRKLFNVFELVIQKIRSINGALIISQANGTIESVTDTGDTWQLGFSEEYPVFAVGDLLRCQVFGGKSMKYYWVTVFSVDGSTVNVLKSEFEGIIPAVGDEVVQIGNDRDPDRQSVIYLSASENGRPVIDVLSGVNSKSFAGKLKGRFGCLDDITDTDFPADYQPSGYGLYSTNAFLKGIFVLRNGKEIETELAALNGEISLRVTKQELDAQIAVAKGEIDLSVTTKINNIQVGTRNYLSNSRINRKPDESAMYQIVEDEQMGTVVEVVNGPGTNFQFNFLVNDRSALKNTDLVYYVIAKEMTSGNWFFGGWMDTYNKLTAEYANKIDLGGGWYQYWVTFKSSEKGLGEDAFGINTTYGTWRFYAAGVLKGNKPASWSPALEDMSSKVELESGIQILKDLVDTKVSQEIFDDLGRKVTETQSQVLVNTEGIAQTVEKVNTATQLALAVAQGTMIWPDPTFIEGGNGVLVYNNTGNGNVVITRTALVQNVPNDSGICLQITTNGPASPYLGGFHIPAGPKPNTTYIWRLIAFVPEGYSLTFHSNYLGVGSAVEWLTSNLGASGWREYGVKVRFGVTDGVNIMADSGYFALNGALTYPVSWFLAYVTVFDVATTQSTATKTQIRQLDDKINLSATAINDLTGRVQSAEIALKPDNIWLGLKDKIKVGGRNTFSFLNTYMDVYGGGTVTREPANKGFTFSPAGISSNLRLARVITETGYWTISFDLNASIASNMYIDFCDIAHPNISVAAGYNGRVSLTVEVTRYSSDIYNFIDISGLSSGTFLFSNVQVEKGNVPTAWTPNPDDVGTKQELLDTGIDIKNRQIVATADTFKIRSNKGQTIALFTNIDGVPKITASNIDVDNLYATSLAAVRGTIGNFSIAEGWLRSINKEQGEKGYIHIESPSTKFTLGSNVFPSTGPGLTCTMILENRITNYAGVVYDRYENVGIQMTVENSDINKFLSLQSFSETKKRTISIETRRFINDADWYYRTCIRLSNMPSRAQINTLGAPTLRNVAWDEVSGYLFWY